MLIKAKILRDYRLCATDGEIGKIKEFYFDDEHRAIRYLVVDTSNWLTEGRVLISPHAVFGIEMSSETISVGLTKNQIEGSPSLGSHLPVSRQYETSYYGYYGWPIYWGGPYMWGAYPYIVRNRTECTQPAENEKSWDPHLRSTHDVHGHRIQAVDGEIGQVEDFIIDDETWAIRYLVVNTQAWLPGKKILISPHWIVGLSWSESKVFVNVNRDAIRHAPEYSQEFLIRRDYETRLHDHYGYRGYWVAESAEKAHAL